MFTKKNKKIKYIHTQYIQYIRVLWKTKLIIIKTKILKQFKYNNINYKIQQNNNITKNKKQIQKQKTFYSIGAYEYI